MSDMPRRLGKYEIVGILGRGGMGTVYRGFDPAIERTVALKTIRNDQLDAGVEDAIARFRNEARAAGRLTHPAIVGVYEYGEDQDVSFIAMEYVEGFGLKEYLSQIGVMPLSDSVSVVMQLLDGLAYAHEQGVVHRDIKPSNLIITSQGKVKITDFGVARLQSSELTQVGTVIGTPSYMSPEQFMGLAADARSDVFSVGVMLYELLTGQRPFTGSMESLAYRICHENPTPASQVQPSVPQAFERIIDRALTKRAEERFPTAGAFRDTLRLALEHELNMQAASTVSEETVIRTVGKLERPVFDPSHPTTHASSASRSQSSTRSSTIERSTLTSVERELASVIGPVASVLVKRAASRATTLNELYEELADKLPAGRDRDTFLARRSGSGHAASGAGQTMQAQTQVLDGGGIDLPDEVLAGATRLLARHIGPIAKVVVKRSARRAGSLDQFHDLLAGEVGDSGERNRFLSELRALGA
ncbi:MAG: serine/threonine protein kinase [Rhodocyclaceae bacterium]|nr:serine/threonine protein kinase [Rhodocyclaceae bacterium]